MRVFRSADEIEHAPRTLTDADRSRFEAQVQFMGTWFPERGPFLVRLIEQGVPLTIRGSSWDKAPEWPRLRPYYQGGPLLGDDYAKSIQCAKVNIGLVSKGNRDLHTGRSIQIPALGGLLCAERTVEHRQLYEEGKEALFWSSADECAEVCRFALADESRRQSMAAAGHARLVSSGLYNEKVLEQILSRAGALPALGLPKS
jgi:spore maturation protein CgeB